MSVRLFNTTQLWFHINLICFGIQRFSCEFHTTKITSDRDSFQDESFVETFSAPMHASEECRIIRFGAFMCDDTIFITFLLFV